MQEHDKDQGLARRGQTSLHAARRDREISTERLVNRARQFGVILGIVQFGLFTDYPAGVRELGLAFAATYGATAWVSGRVLAAEPDLARLRRLTLATLVVDTALLAATALLLAYQNDPTNLLLMVLPLLEAAMKRQLPGALTMSAVAALVEVGRVTLRAQVHDLAVAPAESTFFAGMLLLIALFAGGTVRLQVRAQEDLAQVNDRLATTRRLLRAGLSSFSGGLGLQDILAEAVKGFSLDAAVVLAADGAAVGWPIGTAHEPAVKVLVEALHLEPGEDPRVHHVDGAGRRWMAVRLDGAGDPAGALVTLLAANTASMDPGTADTIALQSELSALMRASAALAVEEEMREAHGRLDRLRHDFVAITSHEIRTPVTVLKAAVELLQSPAGRQRQDELLETAARHTRRLERVADDLHVVQRLDEGALGVELAAVPIERLIQAVLEEAGPDAGSTVDLTVGPDLTAWGDAQLLQTVLRCLVDNALTHGDGRDVRISAEHDGSTVFVDVSDAGPGIPSQARTRVFERFSAVDARHHQQGAGIGLPLARELARLMDGEVALLDEQRTTFRLRLPSPASQRASDAH